MTDNPHVNRRNFLKGAGLLVAGSVGSAMVGCQPGEARAPEPQIPFDDKYPAVPGPPEGQAVPGQWRTFTDEQARLVEALTARILPGTPDDPGAREAGVVVYIDLVLAHNEGIAEPWYRGGPIVGVDSNAPEVAEDQLERYGWQLGLTPRQMYEAGLPAVEALSQAQFGTPFLELTETDQDTLLQAMNDDEAAGFTEVSAAAFFDLLRVHTIEGMFSDPAYGGNRNMAGWRLIGFPGAQRAYTPLELKIGADREPQGLAQLNHFHPGQPAGEEVIQPVSRGEESGEREPGEPLEQLLEALGLK